jgi:hypothetical protein
VLYSIDCLIEDQAFSPSHDLAPPTLPVKLTNGERGGGGAKSYNRKKAWSSINYSILSADNQRNAELSSL